jgi:hypothetical protein
MSIWIGTHLWSSTSIKYDVFVLRKELYRVRASIGSGVGHEKAVTFKQTHTQSYAIGHKKAPPIGQGWYGRKWKCYSFIIAMRPAKGLE